MLELPHVLAGTLIALSVPSPALAIPLALTSHFVLDLIPHWDPPLASELKHHHRLRPTTLILLITDSTAALLLGSHIALLTLPNLTLALTVLSCSFFSVLPDLLGIPELLTRRSFHFIRPITNFQNRLHTKLSALPGILVQFCFSLVCLWLISSRLFS